MTLNEPIELAFAGHETFPLRQQWLKKSVDHVNKAEQDARSDHCFDSDSEDVIIELGVGKNMVKAMRFGHSRPVLLRRSLRKSLSFR